MRSAVVLWVALVAGPEAHAVPLQFSATSFAWSPQAPAGWDVTSTASIELVDLADPAPGVGRFRLDVSGQVVPFSGTRSGDAAVEFVVFSAIRISPGEAFLGLSLVNATGVLQTSSDGSEDQASLNHDLAEHGSTDALPVLPSVMPWAASWEITIDANALGPLDFWFGNGFERCVEVGGAGVFCDGGGLLTGGFSIEVSSSPIPEPGTASLLAMGLMAIVALRQRCRPPAGGQR